MAFPEGNTPSLYFQHPTSISAHTHTHKRVHVPDAWTWRKMPTCSYMRASPLAAPLMLKSLRLHQPPYPQLLFQLLIKEMTLSLGGHLGTSLPFPLFWWFGLLTLIILWLNCYHRSLSELPTALGSWSKKFIHTCQIFSLWSTLLFWSDLCSRNIYSSLFFTAGIPSPLTWNYDCLWPWPKADFSSFVSQCFPELTTLSSTPGHSLHKKCPYQFLLPCLSHL